MPSLTLWRGVGPYPFNEILRWGQPLSLCLTALSNVSAAAYAGEPLAMGTLSGKVNARDRAADHCGYADARRAAGQIRLVSGVRTVGYPQSQGE
jgi:hypothetical protein